MSSSIKYLLTENTRKTQMFTMSKMFKRVLIKETTTETPFNIDITFCTRRLRGFLIFIKVLRNIGIM